MRLVVITSLIDAHNTGSVVQAFVVQVVVLKRLSLLLKETMPFENREFSWALIFINHFHFSYYDLSLAS